jgi:hypothetical protein
VTANIEANGNQNGGTAAIWLFWNSLVAWMPATLLGFNLPPWYVLLIAYIFGDWSQPVAQQDIPVKPTRFGWMELDPGPFKSGLQRIGWVVQGYSWSGIVVIVLFVRVPRFTENWNHATVWHLYGAFVALLPLCLLVQMHFLHALRSGAVIRFAVRHAPIAVLRWLIEQGAAGNGDGPHRPSALTLAASNKNASKVGILLAAGAEVHPRYYASDPLRGVCAYTNLVWGVKTYPEVDTSIVGMLLDAGADVSACNARDSTLLYNISVNNWHTLDQYEPLIHLLLDAGADALLCYTRLVSERTRIPCPRIFDMLLGVIAYQAHLAQHVLPMIEQPNSRIATPQPMLEFREREVLVHAHAAMRRQAWSRRHRAVVAWHAMAYE